MTPVERINLRLRAGMLDEPPSKKRRIGLVILITLLVFMIASTAVSLVVTPFQTAYLLQAVDFSGIGGAVSEPTSFLKEFIAVMKSVVEAAKNMPAWINLITLFTFAFITLACVICRVKIEKGTLYSLGFKKEGALKQYLLGLAIGTAVFSAAVLIGLAVGCYKYEGTVEFSVSNTVYVILFFFGYAVQGMGEEVLCRGFMMTALTRKYSVLCAVAVNSAFFSILHAANPGTSVLAFFNLFLFGVFASVLMLKTDNIWIVCAVHSVWNFVQGNFFGLSVSGNGLAPSVLRISADGTRIWTGGDFGPEGGLCVTAVLLAAIAVTMLTGRKKLNQEEQNKE
ncbi:MAG: CPBP family intramembrane metalloprotease [Clostridia bacterium]|nr:CPBP family intramembrane metalloprotease [Clostridia bacterium]